MIWVFWDGWKLNWSNGSKALNSTLLYEIIDLINGFVVNHEIILKVDFYEMSADNLKGVVFSTEQVSYYGFLP